MLTVTMLEKKLIGDVRAFYLKTDKAHGLDHAMAVMTNASILCFKLKRMDVLRPALVAAAYHDIFSGKGTREVHHIHSHGYLLDNLEKMMRRYGLTRDEVILAAYACLEHRNSWGGDEYNSIVSEIVAAADRGIPKVGEVEAMVKRSYIYHRDHGRSISSAKFHAASIIKEKFGSGNVGAVPKWYGEIFKQDLERRLKEIDALDDSFFTKERTAQWEEDFNATQQGN